MKKLLPSSYSNKTSGFTLIELMVVIAIIAILSMIGFAVYSNSQKAARDATRRVDIDSINSSLEGHYNTTLNQNCTAAATTYCAPLASWFASGSIPVDPKTNSSFTGIPVDGATTYNVCATLEAGGTYCKTNQQQ